MLSKRPYRAYRISVYLNKDSKKDILFIEDDIVYRKKVILFMKKRYHTLK